MMINEDLKNNKDFYPTPKKLFKKMYSKVKNWHEIQTILEPSAGSGTLCDFLKEESRYSNYNIVVIEKDPLLQKELIQKNYRLIDSDFLEYDNSVQADLIFANFPFSEGDKHLSQAIDCLYSGQIVALINAETLKNPYTNLRKELVFKLKQLNADIEYIPNAFSTAQRETDVEVALVYINKEKSFDEELITDLEKEEDLNFTLNQTFDVVLGKDVLNLVRVYEKEKELVTKQLVDFYKNHNYIGHLLSINIQGVPEERYRSETNLTIELKTKLNQLNSRLKEHYWKKILQEDKIVKNLTSKKKTELKAYISKFYGFAFNVKNIQILIKNILEKFSSTIDEAILELFKTFTQNSLKDSRWGDDEYKANIHYYNAWKSNDAYKLNKKVIVPLFKAKTIMHEKSLSWDEDNFLCDIDRVISYFDPAAKDVASTIIGNALKQGITKKIKVNSLLFTFYKKGTVHIEFTDETILRKFNIAVGKLKKELPMDYSEKSYEDLTPEEQALANKFETALKDYKVIDRYSSNIKLLE